MIVVIGSKRHVCSINFIRNGMKEKKTNQPRLAAIAAAAAMRKIDKKP